MTTPLTKHGHIHVEAYCRMTYADSHGNEEMIWNSRDGVTPFICRSRAGVEQQHVRWEADHYAPRYIPDIGERVWVDMPRDKAEAIARSRLRRLGKHHWNPRFPDFESAVAFVADGIWHDGHAPMLVEVDTDWQEWFRTRAIDGIEGAATEHNTKTGE